MLEYIKKKKKISSFTAWDSFNNMELLVERLKLYLNETTDLSKGYSFALKNYFPEFLAPGEEIMGPRVKISLN